MAEANVVLFVGLGMMGAPMARRLLKAGFDVIGMDLSADVEAAFAAAGGRVSETLAGDYSTIDVVITMLPNSNIVRETLLGNDGLAAALRVGALVIDMSSSAPFETRRLADDLRRHGIDLIDAPVSGGVRRAVDGSLAIMAGGEKANIERAAKILKAMGTSITHTGAIGTGHAVKALNNYVSAAGLQAACEALLIAREFGIDPDTLTDVLNVSTGKNNSTELKLKPFIISETFTSGFAMSLMAKDIETAAELARQLGKSEPGLESASSLWKAGLQALGHSADHTEIYRYLAAVRKQ